MEGDVFLDTDLPDVEEWPCFFDNNELVLLF